MKRVLVVGGTSGTGAEVVRLLAARRRESVRVLARRPDAARSRFGASVEVVAGDLLDGASLVAAVDGVDVVVHAAGVRGLLGARRHRAVVVDGMADLLHAARRSGQVKGIIFVSSMGVTRPSALGYGLDLVKGDALANKREAEELVRDSGLDYLVLRAAVLTDGPARPSDVVFSPEPGPVRLGTRIARADVARFVVAALERPRLGQVTGDLRRAA